jgi:outer membrane biosynthesis protein TonB
MGRLSASILALALAVAAAMGLAACGGSDAELLPGKTASEIEANLDSVARLAGEGECVGAANTAQAVSSQVEELGGVDSKLKQALEEGADRLNEVVAKCEEAEPPEEEFETEEPEEEEPEPPTKAEKHEKPEKHGKAEKEEPEAEEPEEEESSSELPPQANGKGKGLENGEGPKEGGGPPSGGVGPGTAVEEGD